jgi:hypothetical protein
LKEWLQKAPKGFYGCEIYLSGHCDIYKFGNEYVNANKEIVFEESDPYLMRIGETLVGWQSSGCHSVAWFLKSAAMKSIQIIKMSRSDIYKS